MVHDSPAIKILLTQHIFAALVMLMVNGEAEIQSSNDTNYLHCAHDAAGGKVICSCSLSKTCWLFSCLQQQEPVCNVFKEWLDCCCKVITLKCVL